MQLVEQVGSGIIRMNDLMREAGLPLPEYTTEGMFTVKLHRPVGAVDRESIKEESQRADKLGDKLGDKTREKIEEILKANGQITVSQLAEILDITYKGVEYHIRQMKKEGVLIRVGSRKAGHWKLTR